MTTVNERFDAFCIPEPNSGCTLWVGGINTHGYGNFWLKGKTVHAHQVAFDLAGKDVPAGYQIDHLCRNRACVRPDHLEAVTPSENFLRGVGLTNSIESRRVKRDRTSTCFRGHDYIDIETKRWCRECTRNRNRQYQSRKAA